MSAVDPFEGPDPARAGDQRSPVSQRSTVPLADLQEGAEVAGCEEHGRQQVVTVATAATGAQIAQETPEEPWELRLEARREAAEVLGRTQHGQVQWT